MAKLLGDSALAARLREVMRGEVLFDAFTRGRYSTDASIYQIEPIGVALPQGTEDVVAAHARLAEDLLASVGFHPASQAQPAGPVLRAAQVHHRTTAHAAPGAGAVPCDPLI